MRSGPGFAAKLSVVALLAGSLLVASSTVALASGDGDGCNPGRTSDFPTNYGLGPYENASNVVSGATSVGGISAGTGGSGEGVYNYSPYVDPTSVPSGYVQDDNAWASWIMLTNSSGNNWMQIGRFESRDAVRGELGQMGLSGSVLWTNYFTTSGLQSNGFTIPGPDAVNSYSSYKISYDPSGADGIYFRNYYDGDEISDSAHDFTPTVGEAANEMTSQATQFAGDPDNHGTTSNLQIWAPAGTGAWYDFSGTKSTIGTPLSSMNFTPASGPVDRAYDVWDSACTP